MKILFRTTYVSNEYWDGTAFCLLEIAPDQVERIQRLRAASIQFFEDARAIVDDKYGAGSIRFSLPGSTMFFDDSDDNLCETALKSDEAKFAVVPDNWQPPENICHARTELHKVKIFDDGMLYLEAICKDDGDYVEVELPEITVKDGQILLTQ